MTRNEWADTYKAVHATTEEKVILKVLVRKSQDEEYINNLLKEVENLKTIRNPNLIHVNNMFKYSGCEYDDDYYSQPGDLFRLMSAEDQQLTCENTSLNYRVAFNASSRSIPKALATPVP